MKNYISILAATFLTIVAHAQVNDSTELGAGYANQSFYSLENGEVANVDNNNWDLAFDLSGFGAAIRLNRRIDVMYVYPGDISNWTTVDTAGLQAWDSYVNGFEFWDEGAINAAADPGDDTDLGWGIYNTLTHATEGSRIFVIELSDGSFRKLFVESLSAGVYSFKYDFLDNSDLENVTITKGDYSGKNFIYYSLETNQIIDREPLTADWDIVFTNYALELAPDYISTVTGVLQNNECYVQEVSALPANEAVYYDGDLEANISTIGYDWKSFNFGTFDYDIVDSLSYFVQTASGDVWQLVFTGFTGSTDGKSYFTKELIGAANFEENDITQLVVYPNPAVNEVNLFNMENIQQLTVYTLNGQAVYNAENSQGNNLLQIDVSAFEQGVYLINAITKQNNSLTQKLVITNQ